MSYLFPVPDVASLPVAGRAERFPIHRIFCVGRNYADHAREMGGDPTREEPFFFAKPADAIVPDQSLIPFPSGTTDLHHEVELVVALKAGGTDIPEAAALDLVWGYGVGIDLTRRDLQAVAKKAGRPWDTAKGFDRSAPCSMLHPVAAIGHPEQARIWLSVNGTVRQDGNVNQMIYTTAEIIAHLSRLFELRAGDLIYTGTPAGVGQVRSGDVLDAAVDGVADLSLKVV